MPLRSTLLAVLALVCVAPAQDTGGGVGRLVQESSSSLVFIEGGGGSGSGFVCKMKDGVFLITNQHVVSRMPRMKLTRLDNSPVKIGAITAAVGHDVMRFVLGEEQHPLIATENLEQDARIGDEIAVLGNSEGSRVIAPLMGKLLGIGPDRIEVSAEFVPGNSGSPIIHLRTGRVIGIATYLEQRRFSALTDSRTHTVRRFGYRLDTIKQWQPVIWPVYQGEQAELTKVETLTQDIARLIDDLSSGGEFHPRAHTNPVLARPVQDLDRALGKQRLSAPDQQRALQHFLATVRSATQSDIRTARERWRYDFFRRCLEEQAGVREQFYQIFDKLMKSSR
jgi:hypothetical protein